MGSYERASRQVFPVSIMNLKFLAGLEDGIQ